MVILIRRGLTESKEKMGIFRLVKGGGEGV